MPGDGNTCYHEGVDRSLSQVTQGALLGSAMAAVAFIGLGIFGFLDGDLPRLFNITLLVLGGVALILVERAWRRRRAPWAYLVAMWGVIAFCAFFTAPEVLDLEQLKQVTIDLELKHGAAAKDMIADENLKIRAVNLGMCILFAAPFVALCISLVRGRRDYERPAA
jgi:hypothetical protein